MLLRPAARVGPEVRPPHAAFSRHGSQRELLIRLYWDEAARWHSTALVLVTVAFGCGSEPYVNLPDSLDQVSTADCSAVKATPSNIQDWCGQGEYLVDSDRRLLGKIVSKASQFLLLQQCRTGLRFRLRTSNFKPAKTSSDSWITGSENCDQPVGQDLATMNAPMDWGGVLSWSDNFKTFLEPVTTPRTVTVTGEIWDSMLGGGCNGLPQPVILSSAYGVQISALQPELPKGGCVIVTLKDVSCLPKL